MFMKRISLNSKREIICMDLVNIKFIDNRRNKLTTHIVRETINENIFVELFHDANLKQLFALKIFSLN